MDRELCLNKKIKLDGELKETKFGDLGSVLGSVPSIIFWSDQQVKLRTNITNMKHTLLTGDYGTGESLNQEYNVNLRVFFPPQEKH